VRLRGSLASTVTDASGRFTLPVNGGLFGWWLGRTAGSACVKGQAVDAWVTPRLHGPHRGVAPLAGTQEQIGVRAAPESGSSGARHRCLPGTL
jgi:hypothetical protein